MGVLVAITLLGRETSWGSAYGLNDPMSDMFERVMAVLLLALTAFISYKWFKNENNKLESIRYLFDKNMIKCFYAIAVFFVLSALFDKKIIVTALSLFEEELCELLAYSLFFVSGYLFNKRLHSNG